MLDILAMRRIPLQYYPEDLEEDIDTLRKMLNVLLIGTIISLNIRENQV